MNEIAQEYFHDFRQSLLADSEANLSFQLHEFMDVVTGDLIDAGIIEGFEFSHYRTQRGMRVDGYWFDDEGTLDLFIADFEFRDSLESLSKTDVEKAFKRLNKFFETCIDDELHEELEITSPEYGLARQIHERALQIRRVNFYLISERSLSDRVQTIEVSSARGIKTTQNVWDISRLQRQQSSTTHKEILHIELSDVTDASISCLPAHLGSGAYKAYLVVMPASVIAELYDKHGSRLLEQNVRCFLQARGKVNKEIRKTIISEPEMFFAYNNGITATAQKVEVQKGKDGLELKSFTDFQIVNGGQTTASLFHTHRKDQASLDKIFVQMKLSVITEDESEVVVPKISEYANSQNRVNAADFFSNHPFHIRFEECSRRIWAPAQEGELRETKWFYERARGQYADEQSTLSPGEKKKFQAKNPKSQMFTKTDLAKFENVWDDKPTFVNLGAQKNFAQYAKRIGQAWEKSPDMFNDYYYKRAIARAILFKNTEKLVSAQPWYNGGYRANIVAYTLALLGFYCGKKGKSVNFGTIWESQTLNEPLQQAIVSTAKVVNSTVTSPESGISNVTEWCKKELCWQRIQQQSDKLSGILPTELEDELISIEEVGEQKKTARKTQKVDNGIEAQRQVIEISGAKWENLLNKAIDKRLLTDKEIGIMKVATKIPDKIPTEKQSIILFGILERLKGEGLV